MKEMLLSAFYLLQGLGTSIFALLFVSVDAPYGGSGGAVTGLEIMIKGFLLFASSISVFTALTFFLKREWTQGLGNISSVFFATFYALVALISYLQITRGFNWSAAVLLLLSILIVILNVMSLYFLTQVSRRNE